MCVKESANDKVLKDIVLEDVQRTKFLVHNPVVNGRGMNREPTLSFAILRMTH
jgi:hypothetical protein